MIFFNQSRFRMLRRKIMGFGPLVVLPPLLVSILLFFANYFNLIPSLRVNSLDYVFYFLALFFAFLSSYLIYSVLIKVDLIANIRNDLLITSGIYSYSRNPLYVAYLFICTTIIFLTVNLYLLGVPFLIWFYMTIVIKGTEEKFLINKFGDDYVSYCRNVNRLIPLKKKR